MRLSKYSKQFIGCMCVMAIAQGVCGCQNTSEDGTVTKQPPNTTAESDKQTESQAETGAENETGTETGTEAPALEEETTTLDLEKYEKYQTEIEDTNRNVKVSVDAVADIPQTDKMSIVRVKQKEITSEMIQKLVSVAAPGEPLYDGTILKIQRVSDIEEEIKSWEDAKKKTRQELEQGKLSEAEAESRMDRYENEIQLLQEKKETTGEKVPWSADWHLEPKMVSVQELYRQKPDNEFYEKRNSNQENTNLYFVVNGEEAGIYKSIYAQNCDKYSSCIRFHSSTIGYIECSDFMVEEDAGYQDKIFKYGEMPLEEFQHAADGTVTTTFTRNEEESVTISEAEAVKKAEEFLAALGYGEYGLYQAELCDVGPEFTYVPNAADSKNQYYSVYMLKYLRDMDGMLVNNSEEIQAGNAWDGEGYTQKFRAGEELVLFVNDTGVIGMNYNAPLEIQETLADQEPIMNFEEIKKIFEEKIVTEYAKENQKQTITIDRVVLRYTRLNAEDDYINGVIAPVWEFYGEIETVDMVSGTMMFPVGNTSILTINAIDGRVINPAFGYEGSANGAVEQQ